MFLKLESTGFDNPSSPNYIYLRHLRGDIGYRVLPSSVPFNWIKCFGGHQAYINGDGYSVMLDNGELYEIQPEDLVYIHLTGESISLTNRIPKCKIMMTVDYGLAIWKECLGFGNISNVCRAVEKADYLLSTEPEIALLLEEHLQRKVLFQPHPVDTSLKRYRKKYTEPKTVSIMIHGYDNDYMLPHLALFKLPYRTHLLGVTDERAMIMSNGTLYNKVSKYTSYEALIDADLTNVTVGASYGDLPYSYFIFDSYPTGRVSGRCQTDGGVLGIPVVGSNCSFFGRYLYPELSKASYYEVSELRKACKKLLDEDYRNEIIKKADDKIEQFNFENSKINLMNFMDGVQYKDWKEVL